MHVTVHSPRSLPIRLLQLALTLAMLFSLILAGSAGADNGKGKSSRRPIKPAPVEVKGPKSKPLARPSALSAVRVASVSPTLTSLNATSPIDLKVLVIAADDMVADDDPSPDWRNAQAITTYLGQIGIPYQVLVANREQLTPARLWDGVGHGYYQGIILTTGSLIPYGSPDRTSALDGDEWNALWEYEARFGVRQVTLYTLPETAWWPSVPEGYGLSFAGDRGSGGSTSGVPLDARLTADGRNVFPYLNTLSPVQIKDAWVYLGTVNTVKDDPLDPVITTPLLVLEENGSSYPLVSVSRYAAGRENLAITMDNSASCKHTALLAYGVINWVTKGLFLGERHVNLNAQVDDLLIASDIWDMKALTDTTGLTYRLTDKDFKDVVSWQDAIRKTYPTLASGLTLEHAFNMEGAAGIYPKDRLTPAVIANRDKFSWVNHTYSHVNLDAVTYDEAIYELTSNYDEGKTKLKLTDKSLARDSLVQPDISGLYNPTFLRAASDFGIRFVIADTSRPEWSNPSPNAGFYSQFQPDILAIPRHPSNLFYNLTTPEEWVSEYNCYYGPNGTCADGKWRYWDRNLTYTEILDKESDFLVRYWLTWDLDPLMFHQANLASYNKGKNSLLGDLLEAALVKYKNMYNLPIRNLTQHEVGLRMAERMAYDVSGVTASVSSCNLVLTAPGLSSSSPLVVPVTGVAFGPRHEAYGGQTISYVELSANQSVSIPVPGCQ